jgi:hypothetical protein
LLSGGGKQVLKKGNPRNEGSAIPLFSGCMHLSGFQIITVTVSRNISIVNALVKVFEDFSFLLY